MGGGVPAGSPEWSWNAAWDECHGVEKRGESEGVWCAALQRGAACESALILKGRPRDLGAIWLRAPPQDVWHRVPRVDLSVTAAMTCNGYWPI